MGMKPDIYASVPEGQYAQKTMTNSPMTTGKPNASDAIPLWFHCAMALALVAGLLLFYRSFYSIHTDLAGIILSGRLSLALGSDFQEYSLYFPPAERVWFSLAARLSNVTGLRLDLAAIAITGTAVIFSTALAYHIRYKTVGASPLFLLSSVAVLVVLPILYKNVFGLREHMVVLGLWPYLVLRLSDPDDTIIGWKTRALVGLWMGTTLLLKYIYSLVVLLVELVDAAAQRRSMVLFRFENVLSGSIVALYLVLWLAIDPSQREAIAAMVSAIDANLASQTASLQQAAIHFSLAVFFVVLGYYYKLPPRVILIGLALAVGAIAASWIQSRWYSHHLFPITLSYVAWLWMFHRELRLLWIVAILVLFVRPIAGELHNSAPYQLSVAELDEVMERADLSVEGKRVGLLTMHPSPFNQYLASHGAIRWVSTMNNAYVAAEMDAYDQPENAASPLPPVTLEDPGRQMLHDEMLRLWEDMPPDVLILDQSTSWPLQHIDVAWMQAFAQDSRFQAILSQYRPAFEHDGEWVEFRYYERID